ncbi:MAG: hypothetical protein EOO04_18120 [Chitinophagaceae bacterium]|nr:MAG: hypothetical protein EOO04_18120 [Chitinophagaceae bacterium]
MLLKYLLLPFLFFTTKETPLDTTPILRAADLLMHRQWVLSSYGFDENNNGTIDPAEERIEECEQDDTYEFFANGTGLMRGNSYSCCNGIDEQCFQWQLIDNGQSLEVFHETVQIQRLTRRELITSKKPFYLRGQTLNVITIYRVKELNSNY